MKTPQQWDLKTLLANQENNLALAIENLHDGLQKNILQSIHEKPLKETIIAFQDYYRQFIELSHLVICLTAQNPSDEEALNYEKQIADLQAKITRIQAEIEHQLKIISKSAFEAILTDPHMQEIRFYLEELRRLADEKLEANAEKMIGDLSVDGFHGWSQMYDLLIGSMQFPMEDKNLSFGQIENYLYRKNRPDRQKAFSIICNRFDRNKTLFAEILNHLSGFRLEIYRQRNRDSFMKEALEENRIQEQTLSAMWLAVQDIQTDLKDFLRIKARMLNVDRLSWYDIEAPAISLDSLHFSYPEATKFVIDHLRPLTPAMSQLAKKAVDHRWIESEDRAGKKPGGFCLDFPQAKESRIFMTFSGTMGNVTTLAHEIGHAFHNECMKDLPQLAKEIPMNLAETASMMAEMITIDGALQTAQSTREQLALLEDKITRSVILLMNIQARFLFEKNFYEKRSKGYVSANRISEMMHNAQKQAFGDALKEYHPLFWASKMHFFFTDASFYNFPYTFGYLLSLKFLQQAKQKPYFEKNFIAFLQDSGRMTTEDLLKKHLGESPSSPNFWKRSMDLIREDISAFQSLSKKEGL